MIVNIVRILESFFARMSHARAMRWGAALGVLIGSVARFRRREVIRTISSCFPERSKREIEDITNGMYRNFGCLLVEILRFGKLEQRDLDDIVEFDGKNPLLEILRQGNGALVLSAHIGNFELLCTMAPLLGIPLTVITKTIKPANLNDHWDKARRRMGVKTLPPRDSYRACRQVLKNNEVLGFVLDQNMKRKHGIFVDFFGRPACTSPGLAFLSARSQTPVVPVFIFRRPDGGHRVEISDPLPPPPNCDPDTIRDATQSYTAMIEEAIRKHPEQWMWLHRRWRTQPL